MRLRIFILILMSLVFSSVANADLPTSLAGISLGQKAPAKKFIPNVSVYGLSGTLFISKSKKGLVEGLEFKFECPDDDCGKAFKKLGAELAQSLGAPSKTGKDGDSFTWEAGDRFLIARTDWDDEQIPFIGISLDVKQPTGMCSPDDGFAQFFDRFKTALSQNDQDALFKFFKLPFEDNYMKVYDEPKALSFKNAKELKGKYGMLFSDQIRQKLIGAVPQCFKKYSVYHIPYEYSHFVVGRFDGVWLIIEIAYEP